MRFNENIERSTERVSEDYLAVNSCGEEVLWDYDVGSWRPRGRSDYHILYIKSGTCYLSATHRNPEVSFSWEEIPAGSIILFRPGEAQEYYFQAKDKSVSHYIHFSGSGCEELLSNLQIDDIRIFSMGRSERYEEISSRMIREYTMKRPFWESFCASYLFELLNIIARKRVLRSSHIGSSGESRINEACRRIYENLNNPPSVAQLASDSCLSISRFSHLFHEVTGKSPLDFTQSMRMERAREMLSSTDLSIREISDSLGFSDQNYFSRLFKRITGVSPREWRKNYGEKLHEM